MNRFVKTIGLLTGASLVCSATVALAAEPSPRKNHVVEIDHPVLTPEEGLLLGNGDLSVSVYQAADNCRFPVA